MQPIQDSTSITTSPKRFSPIQHRSIVRQHWGVLFAILVFLVTTLLSLEHLPAKPILSAQQVQTTLDHQQAPTETEQNVSVRRGIENTAGSTARSSGEPARTFEDIDFNRGWRRGKSGWVRIQQYRVEPAVPLNIVQKVSPIFWGLCLWMFAILLLVMAS